MYYVSPHCRRQREAAADREETKAPSQRDRESASTARRSASCASCMQVPNSTAFGNYLMLLR